MAYIYYKTTNYRDLFFCYAIRSINGVWLLIYYCGTRIILFPLVKSQVPSHLGNSA